MESVSDPGIKSNKETKESKETGALVVESGVVVWVSVEVVVAMEVLATSLRLDDDDGCCGVVGEAVSESGRFRIDYGKESCCCCCSCDCGCCSGS